MNGVSDLLQQAISRHQQGDLANAEPLYRAVLRVDPATEDARALLGVLRAQRGDIRMAASLVAEAIMLAPARSDFCGHLGGILAMAADGRRAARFLTRAVALNPANLDAHTNLGKVETGAGRFGAALDHLRAALILVPSHVEATLNLADALRRGGDPLASQRWAARAMRLAGRRPEMLAMLAQALADAGHLTEAVAAIDEAAQAAPGVAGIQWTAALIHLGAGDLQRGWPRFESRFAADPKLQYLFPPSRQWRGEPIAGRRLLVWWEQGIGDEIFFASCLPELMSSGARVTVGCDRRLADLFGRSFPGLDIIAAGSPPELRHAIADDAFDFHAPSGSLAALLRPRAESFPPHGGFLRADDGAVAAWRERAAAAGEGLRVGILWRGLLSTAERGPGYTTLADWRAVFDVPGLCFYDLQYGDTAAELRDAPPALRDRLVRFPYLNLRNDFDNVAALMTALDLVIAPNTAAITLAGALGRPAWVLSRGFDWMRLGTDHYPWAPSIRCFLAPPGQPWGPTMEAVAQALRHRVA